MNNRREFGKLLVASFVSQTGSHFLTLTLSGFIFITTQSAILASLIFVFSYLPSVLVSSKLGHWVDQKISKWMIARNELISIAATILCGFCVYLKLPIFVLCMVLGIRSLLLFIGRSAATKWLKLISDPAVQTERIKLFYLAFFLSTAVSGFMAAQVLNNLSISKVVGLDCISYLIGIGFYLSLSAIPAEPHLGESPSGIPEEKLSILNTLSAIFTIPSLKMSFVIVCAAQAIFQGAYSVLVTYLPVKILLTGAKGIGWFQIAASAGITAGFLVNWFIPKLLREQNGSQAGRAIIASMIAVTALLFCVCGYSIATSLALFTLFNFAYECIWLHHSSEFFRASPKRHAARYQFTLASAAAFVMAVTTLAYATAMQFLGLLEGVCTVLVAGASMTILAFYLSSRKLPAAIYEGNRS